jgi:hypothetical protein
MDSPLSLASIGLTVAARISGVAIRPRYAESVCGIGLSS